MGLIFGVSHQAVYACGGTANFVANATAKGGAGVSRPGVTVGQGESDGSVPGAGTGGGTLARAGSGRSGALHVSRAGTGEQLFLWLQQVDCAARGHREGFVSQRSEIRPEEVS